MSKRSTSKPSDTTDWERVAATPDEAIDTSGEPFDADDPVSIDAFWEDAVVTPAGGGAKAAAGAILARKGRGSQKTPAKVLISVRYSPRRAGQAKAPDDP